MRGVGGPLLCIGDLLSDVAADDNGDPGHQEASPPSSPTVASGDLHPSHLHQLFQENYDQLVKSLAGHDHSWTGLTLKLCSALKTADKLVSSANANSSLLLERVEILESIIKRGDSAVEAAKAIPTIGMDKVESSK
ncbi:hypothetical protein J5N97_002863 [Dioscorea zingiberensis]|uniref:Uncharacterized protein n=1 Tax=Dioscorea zingiberensis TaxID=325984 RepID=A0A9D5D549_9LILI|nr:hypothetical protein J5N97_002863 [Dioscorea zingiberensis]